jgi:hypothetical protein
VALDLGMMSQSLCLAGFHGDNNTPSPEATVIGAAAAGGKPSDRQLK